MADPIRRTTISTVHSNLAVLSAQDVKRNGFTQMGHTQSISHCVFSCEMKKCHGFLGGWLAEFIMLIVELDEPSSDALNDLVAGNVGHRKCSTKLSCLAQCRSMGF